MPKSKKPVEVIVTVEDGLVEVEAPPGVIVKVFDYDIDGVEISELSKDDNGRKCIASEYGGE